MSILLTLVFFLAFLTTSCFPPRDINNKFSAFFVKIDQLSTITQRNQLNYQIRGLCNEVGATVFIELMDINLVALSPEPLPICRGAGNFETRIDTRILEDGVIIVRISQEDASGVIHEDKLEINKDITPLSMTVEAENILTDTVSNYELRGTCSEWGREIDLELTDVNDYQLKPDEPIICTEGEWRFSADVTTLAEGRIVINAIHRDAAKKPYYVDLAIKKDILLPTISINPPSSILALSARSYNLSGSCSENQSLVTLKLYHQDNEGNAGSYSVNGSTRCENGNWQDSLNPFRLQDGQIILVVNHYDEAGNSQEERAYMEKDVIKPNISITRADNIFPSTTNSYSLSGNCSENQRDIEIELADNDSTTPDLTTLSTCTNNIWGVNNFDISSLSEGAIIITISQSDLIGNTKEKSVEVVKSNSSLIVTVDSVSHINISNKTDYQLTGTCSPSGGILTLTVGGIPPLGQPECESGLWSARFNLELILDSPSVTVTAEYTDEDEIEAAPQFSTTIIKDTITTSISLDSPPSLNRISDSSYLLSGDCSEDQGLIAITIDSLSFQDYCISSRWSYTADMSSLEAGTFTIYMTHTDEVGNFFTASEVVRRDNSVIVTLEDPENINDLNESSYTLSGTCSEVGSEITVDIEGISPTIQPTCEETFSWAVENFSVSALEDGSFSINITHSGASTTKNVFKGCVSLMGTGTQANPFVICNYADLKSINNNRLRHYILGQDIDASESWSEHENNSACTAFDGITVGNTNPCSGMDPIGLFMGRLNGDHYEISNIYMRSSQEELALFSEISDNAVIQNLHLRDLMIVNTLESGEYPSTGGLVGLAGPLSTINHCSVTGTIEGKGSSGGIVGYSNGVLNNSYADASVTGLNAGGLIGYSNAGRTTHSHSKGTVTGLLTLDNSLSPKVGGLIGYMSDSAFIQNSISNVDISGGINQGGLVGDITDNSGVRNSYSLSSLTHNSSSLDGGLMGSVTTLSPLSLNLFWATDIVSDATQAVGSDSTIFSTSETTAATRQVACLGGVTHGICGLGDGFYFSSGQNPAIKKCLDCSQNNPTHSSELVPGQGATPLKL